MPEDDDNLSDEALFRAHVGPVRPIKSNSRISPQRDKPKPKPGAAVRSHSSSNIDTSSAAACAPVGRFDQLFYAQAGLQQKTIRRLKQGRIPIDDELDLHGLVQTAAEQTLVDFLEYCVESRHRCILIIHGKGMHGNEVRPVLKNLTNSILRNHSNVLAYTSTQSRDGGVGAVYVLLKQKTSPVEHQ